jgi:phosphoenolpyruvate---glycerone phosphotransferase subunit DhaM
VIGIVVVSHSPALARAAVDLAFEMVGDSPPPLAIAAGAGDNVLGTDAVRVAEAIDEVSGPDGVLVFMDLGSAVLSATMALEFTSSTTEVRLSDAPFVEGIVAAVVLAAAGATLDDIEREAHGAMDAKRGQLQPAAADPAPAGGGDSGGDGGADAATALAEEELVNPDGLHSRPAAAVVKSLAALDATVTLTDLTTNKGPVSASSLIAILSLGAERGHILRISATGQQANEAVETIRLMAAGGFGELPA